MTQNQNLNPAYYMQCLNCNDEATYQIRWKYGTNSMNICPRHYAEWYNDPENIYSDVFRRPNHPFYNPLDGDLPENCF